MTCSIICFPEDGYYPLLGYPIGLRIGLDLCERNGARKDGVPRMRCDIEYDRYHMDTWENWEYLLCVRKLVASHHLYESVASAAVRISSF